MRPWELWYLTSPIALYKMPLLLGGSSDVIIRDFIFLIKAVRIWSQTLIEQTSNPPASDS